MWPWWSWWSWHTFYNELYVIDIMVNETWKLTCTFILQIQLKIKNLFLKNCMKKPMKQYNQNCYQISIDRILNVFSFLYMSCFLFWVVVAKVIYFLIENWNSNLSKKPEGGSFLVFFSNLMQQSKPRSLKNCNVFLEITATIT